MPTIFEYTVNPSTVVHSYPDDPSVVDLEISVYNPKPVEVYCPWITFSVPIGQNSSDLVSESTVSRIVLSVVAGTPWSFEPDGWLSGHFTARPYSGISGLGAHDSIAFLLSNVVVSDLSGVAAMTVQEGGDNPSGETQITITKVDTGLEPDQVQINSFQAKRTAPPPGNSFDLEWTTLNATSCTLNGSPVEVNGSVSNYAAFPEVYLRAQGPGVPISMGLRWG